MEQKLHIDQTLRAGCPDSVLLHACLDKLKQMRYIASQINTEIWKGSGLCSFLFYAWSSTISRLHQRLTKGRKFFTSGESEMKEPKCQALLWAAWTAGIQQRRLLLTSSPPLPRYEIRKGQKPRCVRARRGGGSAFLVAAVWRLEFGARAHIQVT